MVRGGDAGSVKVLRGWVALSGKVTASARRPVPRTAIVRRSHARTAGLALFVSVALGVSPTSAYRTVADDLACRSSRVPPWCRSSCTARVRRESIRPASPRTSSTRLAPGTSSAASTVTSNGAR